MLSFVCLSEGLFAFGRHGDVVVSTVASQQEGSWFESQLGPFYVEFACSPRVCMGSLHVLWLPPTTQTDSKLSLGVSVSVCVVVCLCCSVMD